MSVPRVKLSSFKQKNDSKVSLSSYLRPPLIKLENLIEMSNSKNPLITYEDIEEKIEKTLGRLKQIISRYKTVRGKKKAIGKVEELLAKYKRK